MLSVSDYGLGNLIQEDIQANLSKMLDMIFCYVAI